MYTNEGKILSTSYQNLLGLVLQTPEGKLVIAVYDLSLNVHESLLACLFLKDEDTYLNRTVITEAKFVTDLSFSSYFLKRSLYFITDKLLFGINVNPDSMLEVEVKENQRTKFDIRLIPGNDPITGKPKPIRSSISQTYSTA